MILDTSRYKICHERYVVYIFTLFDILVKKKYFDRYINKYSSVAMLKVSLVVVRTTRRFKKHTHVNSL